MQLWRLRSPRICSGQAGDAEEPVLEFLSKSRRDNSESVGLRAAEDQCPTLRDQAERSDSPFLHLFVLFRPSLDWVMRPTYLGVAFTNSNVNFTQKHPHSHTQNNV